MCRKKEVYMVSPVSFNSSPKVNFKGVETDFENLVNQPGAYTQAPVQPDEFVSGKEKKGIGKKILKTVVGVAIAAAALFGLHKWKGAKWNVDAAEGFLAKVKKFAVKPGEWIDKNVVQKVGNLFKKGAKAAAETAETSAA